MIVVVAPYSPPGAPGPAHLGAARKIELVVELLHKIDSEIIFVNSSHAAEELSPLLVSSSVVGSVKVLEIRPPTYRNRTIGKAINIFDVDAVVKEVLSRGRPQLTWLYNGYAFECRFGWLMHEREGSPVILEMEDWHFARGRGFSPKPLVDWFFYSRLLPRIEHAFCVNSTLATRIGRAGRSCSLLPGIVPDEISKLGSENPPFTSVKKCLVGYFGGLSVEKGADLVAALAHELPDGFQLLTTGSGELEQEFRRLNDVSGGKLTHYGRVSSSELVDLIGRCDVLINPHSDIEAMGSGVFPFKVVEAVASGRLLISTKLPSTGLAEVLVGVRFVHPGVRELAAAILSARDHYLQNKLEIASGAHAATSRFGSVATLDSIRQLVGITAAQPQLDPFPPEKEASHTVLL